MAAAASSTDADILELRLDYLEDPARAVELAGIQKPKIATCMPKWEGGRFKGGEEERFGVLMEALEYSNYVTYELAADPALRDDLIESAHQLKKQVILAHHDFQETPPKDEILAKLEGEEQAGADVAKVAYMAQSPRDAFTVLQALVEQQLAIPVIALAMGEYGRFTRVLGPMLGGLLTYAVASQESASAPGQLTVEEIRNLTELFTEE